MPALQQGVREQWQAPGCRKNHVKELDQVQGCRKNHVKELGQVQGCRRDHVKERWQAPGCRKNHVRELGLAGPGLRTGERAQETHSPHAPVPARAVPAVPVVVLQPLLAPVGRAAVPKLGPRLPLRDFERDPQTSRELGQRL